MKKYTFVIVGSLFFLLLSSGCEKIPKTFFSVHIDDKTAPRVTQNQEWLFPVLVAAYTGTKIQIEKQTIVIQDSKKRQLIWVDLKEKIGKIKLSSLSSHDTIHIEVDLKFTFVNGRSKRYGSLVLESSKLFYDIALGKTAFPTYTTQKTANKGKSILTMILDNVALSRPSALRDSDLLIRDLLGIAIFKSVANKKKISCGPYVRKKGTIAVGKPFFTLVTTYKEYINVYSMNGKKMGNLVVDSSSCPKSFLTDPSADSIYYQKGASWKNKVEALFEKALPASSN